MPYPVSKHSRFIYFLCLLITRFFVLYLRVPLLLICPLVDHFRYALKIQIFFTRFWIGLGLVKFILRFILFLLDWQYFLLFSLIFAGLVRLYTLMGQNGMCFMGLGFFYIFVGLGILWLIDSHVCVIYF